ncbi:MAG TPA: 7TM domain-containing protein [Candidatus Andersenbacteria bacterium]|nr:7TM domain-containing protein [Candidatus Andersenbacteria bacterium]
MKLSVLVLGLLLFWDLNPMLTMAQEPEHDFFVRMREDVSQSFTGKLNDFSIDEYNIPNGSDLRDIVWNFGDGTQITGEKVTHAYKEPGIYTVRVSIITDNGEVTDTSTKIRIFNHVAVLVIDNTFPEDQIEVRQLQASQEQVLLTIIRAKINGPEAAVEEALINQLLDAREAIKKANIIIMQTSGSVGVNVLSKLAQHIQQVMQDKGIIMLSDTPFGVLTPSAQFAFNQLKPSYILLAKPDALKLLLEPLSPEAAKQKIITLSSGHRLLGEFSARTIKDIGPTNFMSFGINYLINKGVPINSISLILMLPVIATILSFSRQVIGMKAFGIVTPAMTTLSFLVMGLPYGLVIFFSILIAGTITRLAMRKLHLLYLPRMALVLTGVSLAILLVFGLGVATNNTALASFSIFPILILTLLAEEFIALQYKSGAKKALTVTAWTLALAVGCYFIVSWQIVRTLFLSYPEIVLLAIPINILLGRWTGLRLTEYIRFRRLLRYI